MRFIYNCAMALLSPAMSLLGRFNPKARLWFQGRRDIFAKMSSSISLGDRVIWFHVASLGEFEQGRPLIELMRERHPQYKILITFFSPSGFEVRKNYALADYIFYLPSDTPSNVSRFMNIVRPKAAFFIKYEFWLNYLDALKQADVPTFLVSSIFRPEQIFFKSHGAIFRKGLDSFTHIFTQNEESVELLTSIGFSRATAVGDTRFDRVYDIVRSARDLPVLDSFVGAEGKAFIAGSTWEPDEKILLELINANPQIKFVIAPHEIVPERIASFRSQIEGASLLYTDFGDALSQAEGDQLAAAQVLFLNTIGVLSSAYKYGYAAYIGGGFGVGIHNTLEAATFALPLAFGPNYQRFKEARELIERGGARTVSDAAELKLWFEETVCNREAYGLSSKASGDYVAENIGATEAVLDFFVNVFERKI